MVEEIIGEEFRFKNIDETKNYFLEEIEQMNWWVKSTTILHYIEHFLLLASEITVCILISALASLIGVSIEITSSAIGLKICAIFAGVKKY